MRYKTASLGVAAIAAVATAIGVFHQIIGQNSGAIAAGGSVTQVSGSNNIVGNNNTLIQNSQFETPEKDISRLVLRTGRLSLGSSEPFLQYYGFEPWIDRGEFKTYLLYSGGHDPSPTARMILVFARDELCAIVHDKDIDINSDAVDIAAPSYPMRVTYTNWCYHEDDLNYQFKSIYTPIFQIGD